MAELLFEGLAVPGASLAKSAELSALAFGRTSATVVDVGAGVTSVAHVHEGKVAPARLREHPFAGRALDLALLGALQKQGVELQPASSLLAGDSREAFRHHAARRIAQDMK